MTDLVFPIFGPMAWIDVVVLVWIVMALLSTAYVAWDAFTQNPELTVMKWGWVLVTLYTGLVGAALYVMSCKEPRPGTHERFITPLWKQGVGSAIHCVAGDATGIVAGATVTALIGFPMWIDLVVEYVFGFAFGLFIFQALFMKDMAGGSYRKALGSSFLPEWLSMNMVMAGMIPAMIMLGMGQDMRAMEPSNLVYWGTMSASIIVGFLFALPVNVWLVAVGLKHGMGTQRALGKGGHSMAAEKEAQASRGSKGHTAKAGSAAHGGMA